MFAEYVLITYQWFDNIKSGGGLVPLCKFKNRYSLLAPFSVRPIMVILRFGQVVICFL